MQGIFIIFIQVHSDPCMFRKLLCCSVCSGHIFRPNPGSSSNISFQIQDMSSEQSPHSENRLLRRKNTFNTEDNQRTFKLHTFASTWLLPLSTPCKCPEKDGNHRTHITPGPIPKKHQEKETRTIKQRKEKKQRTSKQTPWGEKILRTTRPEATTSVQSCVASRSRWRGARRSEALTCVICRGPGVGRTADEEAEDSGRLE